MLNTADCLLNWLNDGLICWFLQISILDFRFSQQWCCRLKSSGNRSCLTEWTVKVKSKAPPLTCHEDTQWAYRYTSTLSLTMALDWGGWLTPRPCHFTPGKRPGTHCIGGWVDPKASLDLCGKSRPTGIWSLDPPACSKSLYQLRCLCPGFGCLWGRDFSHLSRPVLGPTRPTIKRVPGPWPRGKATGVWHWPPTPSSAEVKERIELYLWVFMGYSRVNSTTEWIAASETGLIEHDCEGSMILSNAIFSFKHNRVSHSRRLDSSDVYLFLNVAMLLWLQVSLGGTVRPTSTNACQIPVNMAVIVWTALTTTRATAVALGEFWTHVLRCTLTKWLVVTLNLNISRASSVPHSWQIVAAFGPHFILTVSLKSVLTHKLPF